MIPNILRAILLLQVVVCFAQPTNLRSKTEWRATNENIVYTIFDDGGQNPVLSGYLSGRSNFVRLVPAAFDYRSNVFRSVGVGGSKTQSVEIFYVECEEGRVKALIKGKQTWFYAYTGTNR